ncbi:hypothetical protein [Micrococcus luteus]|uniref:hypothetical protein n=1 Tax=Micrococcus luteus TaxID=1270 RepID=UPI003318CDA7
MAPAGRPPVPNEIKRRRGTARPDRTPDVATVVALPMADGIPEHPTDFGLEAKRLWERIWQDGVTWISPKSDAEAAEQACRLADDIAVARERYRATREPADGRMVATFHRELAAALGALGFDPASRTRLGVAEVTRVSKLEALRAQKR